MADPAEEEARVVLVEADQEADQEVGVDLIVGEVVEEGVSGAEEVLAEEEVALEVEVVEEDLGGEEVSTDANDIILML